MGSRNAQQPSRVGKGLSRNHQDSTVTSNPYSLCAEANRFTPG